MLKSIALFTILWFCFEASAQSDSSAAEIRWSGYIETYYSYDASEPSSKQRPNFIYSHNRHNELNVNLGFVKATVNQSKYRSNFALMTGSYANANLANEPGLLRAIFEANLGLRLSKKQQLWLDVGVMPSHIGFESAIGKDCWTLTRSIVADNSPYYESGLKLNFTSSSKKLYLAALVLNGWQRIARPAGYNKPAIGHQLNFKPNDRILLSSNSFFGTALPDSVHQNRIYHNLYAIIELSQHLGLILGLDNGWQQSSTNKTKFEAWYSPVVILKFTPVKKLAIAFRSEYYSDRHQVVITSNTANGFQTYGYSLNCDFNLAENFVWRAEGKAYSSKDAVFVKHKTTQNRNFCFSTALALSF